MKKIILLVIGCALMHTVLSAQNYWQIGMQTFFQRQQFQTNLDPSGNGWHKMPCSTELSVAYQRGPHWQVAAAWTFRQAYELPFAPLGHLISATRIEKNAEAALHVYYKYSLAGPQSKILLKSGIGARLGLGEAHRGYYTVKDAKSAYVLNPKETLVYSSEFKQGESYGLHTHYWFMDIRQGLEYPVSPRWSLTLTGSYTIGFQNMGGLSGTFQVLPAAPNSFQISTQGTHAGIGLGVLYNIAKSPN